MNLIQSHSAFDRHDQDELIYGCMPKKELRIDPSLKLHQDDGGEIDPITYEVIRSKLWNVNLDHGETVRRTSGSFIVAESNDFNVTIATEIGEGTAFGQYNWFFAGYVDLNIQWILEHRSRNPGIADGDVFIHNDPWVGTNHQNDAAMLAPVFWGSELFAWIYNCVHQRDVGGPTPGSMSPIARNVFEESICIPPIKLVERGAIREDVLDMWTRRTRMAAISALEVKSQLGGIQFARARLLEIIGRYGPRAVKRAMKKTIDDASRIVGERLSRLPDGIWRDERYIAGAGPGSSNPLKLCLEFEKRGDRLRIGNAGTEPATGMLNFSAGAFRGSVLSGLFHVLAFDTDLCGAGVLRQMEFDLEPGLISSATFPAAVSMSIGTMATLAQAFNLGSKMVSGDPELALHGTGSNTLHTMGAVVPIQGTDQYGHPYQGSINDLLGGGGGGYPDRDGLDHAGPAVGANTPISDVEIAERTMPVLCLFRRELPDSGGSGAFRGGPAIVSAWVTHRTPDTMGSGNGLLCSVTMGTGLDGAPPATGGGAYLAQGSAVPASLAGGRIPSTLADIEAITPDLTPMIGSQSLLSADSLVLVVSNAGAGYGDPLRRNMERVAADAADGRVTEQQANRFYGVALAEDGGCDHEATLQLRRQIITDRISTSSEPRLPCLGRSVPSEATRKMLRHVHHIGGWLVCGHCGQHLAEEAGHYRLGCRELEQSPPQAAPYLEDSEAQTGESLVVRTFLCPGCGAALDSELCRPGSAPYQDFRLLIS